MLIALLSDPKGLATVFGAIALALVAAGASVWRLKIRSKVLKHLTEGAPPELRPAIIRAYLGGARSTSRRGNQ